MNKIGLVFLAPKRVASSEFTFILNETKEFVKMMNYYHGDGTTSRLEALLTTSLGASNYISNYLKSVFKIPIKYLSMSIYDADTPFLDLARNYNYECIYVFCLWDGVDEVVRQQISSADKFGYKARIKMVKRWQVGEKTFV